MEIVTQENLKIGNYILKFNLWDPKIESTPLIGNALNNQIKDMGNSEMVKFFFVISKIVLFLIIQTNLMI